MQNDFDVASVSYDDSFTNTTIGKAQRNQVYKNLDSIVKNGKKSTILDLNCGTGKDANYLHNLHHNVTATDISIGMINEAKKKYRTQNIDFFHLNINELEAYNFGQKFDLIFSNFGGFNCLSKKEIQIFFKSASKILTKNGKIVLVIMPKNTLWEKIYFSLKGNFKKASRRNTNNFVEANVYGIKVKTWYFNPKEIIKIASGFRLKKTSPIGLFVPPSYLQSSFLGNKNMVKFLNFLDSLFGFSFLAKYADHYYIELQKNTNL